MPVQIPPYAGSVDPAQSVWRYIDYPQLLHLLHSTSLYFPRLDAFSDRFEGHLPRPPADGPDAGSRRAHESELQRMRAEAERRAKQVFASCWHMNDVESAAMWSVYGARGNALAIRTTFGRLTSALRGPHDVLAGAVKYLDFETERLPEADFFAPLFHKRKSFSHEREVRLVLHDPENQAGHRRFHLVPVDLTRLIERLYLAPDTPDTITAAIADLLEKYRLGGIRVSHSSLDDGPVY